MNELALSELEAAIVAEFFSIYGAKGFPPSSDVRVISRRETGAGRVVGLTSGSLLNFADGYLDMGGRFIEMDGIAHGLMAVISIVGSKLDTLEIATYGDVSWDGCERNWRIV